MTEAGVTIWLLVLCLALGAVVTLTQLITFTYRLRLDTTQGVNGATSVILRGTVRRLAFRFVIQSALIAQFGVRLFGVRSPEFTLIVILLVVLSLAADTVGDTMDYRILRYMLRNEGKS